MLISSPSPAAVVVFAADSVVSMIETSTVRANGNIPLGTTSRVAAASTLLARAVRPTTGFLRASSPAVVLAADSVSEMIETLPAKPAREL